MAGDRVTSPRQRGERERPTCRRRSCTYDVRVQDAGRVHVTLGRYPDGRLCEVFINASKCGSDVRTAFEAWAMLASKALQHGVPADAVARSIRRVSTGHSKGAIVSPEHLEGCRASSLWDAIAQLLDTT